MIISKEERRVLVDTSKDYTITLDGKPALVTGSLSDYASIKTLDGKQSIVFSWCTVRIVMMKSKDRTANFKS